MARSRRVLIVDPSIDSREVIRTALERQGVAVFEADSARRGDELMRRCHPDLVVVDGEIDGYSAGDSCAAWDTAGDIPRVVLGRIKGAATGDRQLSKPYQYSQLIRTIGELLGTHSGAQRPAA
ncbi:MAG: hypothetical protein KDA63_10280 [Planctomycetales bacterium]|nr:hypothetical protein [Planctomycetales bacterium]